MSESRVAVRYAKSLFDLAEQESQVEAVKDDMLLLQQALESKDLVLLLKSPIIKFDKKITCLKAIFSDKISTLVMRFFELVTKKGREPILTEISEEFMGIYNEKHNIVKVDLISASPLDQDTMDIIADKVKNILGADKKIEFVKHLDPTLLGGFVVKYQDKLLDNSIAYQLGRLRKTFSNN